MANKPYRQVQMYVYYTFGVFPRIIALVLREHSLMQACGVIGAYDFNLLGKLSLVLLSVPQKIHNKVGLVKKRGKRLGKKPCLSVEG